MRPANVGANDGDTRRARSGKVGHDVVGKGKDGVVGHGETHRHLGAEGREGQGRARGKLGCSKFTANIGERDPDGGCGGGGGNAS